MFPLSVRKVSGYKFRQPTSYFTANGHLGVDYSANYVNLFAPFTGNAIKNPFTTGGNVIDFHCNPYGTPLIIRFMHLSKYIKLGQVNEGEVIAVTGNTGTFSSAPHLHIDISNNSVQIHNINNFLDPETFNWGGTMKKQRTFFQSGTAVLMHLLPEDLASYEANDGIYHPIIRGTYFNEDKKEVLCTIEEPKFLDTSGVSPAEVLPSIATIIQQRDTLSNQLELSGETIDAKEDELVKLTQEYTKAQQDWLIQEEDYQVEIGKLLKKLDGCKCVDDPIRDYIQKIIDWIKNIFRKDKV